jgi:hypothetical protein
MQTLAGKVKPEISSNANVDVTITAAGHMTTLTIEYIG